MNIPMTPTEIEPPADTDQPVPTVLPTPDASPSEYFVRAVSDFFDTDPTDLLAELGYYDCTSGTESQLLSE
ncbi:MAG: hypothetical protein WCP07_03940 [bacterium]|jgi:hypothetical protein